MDNKVDLSKYDNTWFQPGRGVLIRSLWFVVEALFLRNTLNPSSALKRWFLRMFGARISTGVVIKPGIHVKYPWNLQIGDHAWIGEDVWLDSLTQITIGRSVCISQGAYICTGNHDWQDPAFGLIVEPVVIEEGAWIGARAVVLPGVTVASHSVVAAGSVVTASTEPFTVYAGNPAVAVKTRKLRTE